ncbi:MAG: hypothetical protein KME59_23425 [Trichormus sp. ATA11-4-KO1]|nr:hypothetical protein [Trichormus sp. ATA11-4-KO1]
MAEVLVNPQFQVVTHLQTGAKTGRIYFPALFLAEFHSSVIKWLQRQEIHFSEQDIKKYGDGSFRLYFKTSKDPEIEYFELMAIVKNLNNSYCY